MRLAELNLPTVAGNLAADETLLDWCAEGDGPEVLAFWAPSTHAVVLGFANPIRTELNLTACERAGIPVFRRCTGGGTVLQGPGCLNYSLVLRVDNHPECHSITTTNTFIMERHRAVIERLTGMPVERAGVTDLAVGGLKVSGNAQRRKRDALLFHGSFLLDFDLPLIERYLAMPSKQPDYRQNRAHCDFLTNLYLSPESIRQALAELWQADDPLPQLPMERITALEHDRYSTREWIWKF